MIVNFVGVSAVAGNDGLSGKRSNLRPPVDEDEEVEATILAERPLAGAVLN